MDNLVMLSFIAVLFSYLGGNNVPNLLKNNKKILLGFFLGMIYCEMFKKDNIETHCGSCEGDESH